VLLLASPAMAAVSITVAPGAETCTATISYNDNGDPCYVRAFALDITVTGANIVAVDEAMGGDCNATDKGYGIFPGSFARVIDAGDPNWEDPGYSPVGYVDDLPGDTQPGIGTSGVTVEMGSLYVDGNEPPSSGVLCTVTVDAPCTMSVVANAGRGGVVLEDASTVAPDVSGATDVAIPCAVGCACLGDADNDNLNCSSDMTLLVMHLFYNGGTAENNWCADNPIPAELECMELDNDDTLCASDMTLLVMHLFYNGGTAENNWCADYCYTP
jgi:hypothetical protein